MVSQVKSGQNIKSAVASGIKFLSEQPKLLCVFTTNADGRINFERSRGDGGVLLLTNAMGVVAGGDAQRACERLLKEAPMVVGRPVVRKEISNDRYSVTIGVRPS